MLQVRNHEPERLLELVGRNGRVRIGVHYPSILRTNGNYCFSIIPAEIEWTECDTRSIRSTTAVVPSPRLETHGEVVVPGNAHGLTGSPEEL
jgi:hypothetical protein